MARASRKKPSGGSARPVKVGEQVRYALGEMLADGSIKDPRVHASSMVTITDVRMSPDLKYARVFVSVYPDDPELVASVFAGLESAKKEMQRGVGARIGLRFTPEIQLAVDGSMAEGARIEAILKQVRPDDPDVAVGEGDADEAGALEDDAHDDDGE